MKIWSLCVLWSALLMTSALGATPGPAPTAPELELARQFVAARFLGQVPTEGEPTTAGLLVLANHDAVQRNARNGEPLKSGDRVSTHGLYCHAPSRVLVRLPGPGARLTALAGVDAHAQPGTVVFSVDVAGREAFRSPVLRGTQPPVPVDVDLAGATEFTLNAGDGGDNFSWDQSDWIDAKVILQDGRELWLGDLPFLPRWGTAQTPAPFFSFNYGGKSSADFLPTWKVERAQRRLDEARTEQTLTYTDPATGLIVSAVGVQYADYPTVEWTLHFKNNGPADTPILSELKAIDLGLASGATAPSGAAPGLVLRHNRGSQTGVGDYQPLETALAADSLTTVGASNGRPTEENMPYFNIDGGQAGWIVVLGWPGQWSAQFTRDSGSGVRVQAGQELTHFTLHPGESVRTPLVVLQFWSGGDWIRAQNVWRRWMVAHNLPRFGGKVQPSHLAACSSHQFAEMQKANEENQNLFIDRYLEENLPLDYWWMDAGWYTNYGSWMNTGTWDVDRQRFPHGLRGISDHAHAKGVKTIVWFEPECVTPQTWLAEKHRDWVLGAPGWTDLGHDNAAGWSLLNLGNPQAREWLTGMLDQKINDEGIDLYRQDFRLGPVGAWRANDAPDRQGITEIRHCEGYLANWDELRRRHPNLPIDSCAAGGRRNELEAMRRAIPLLRSDFILDPLGNQCHTYGISFWLPLYGTGVNSADPYEFRSVMVPMLNACYDVRRKDLDYEAIRRLIGQWKCVTPYFVGDYYPLTAYSADRTAWIAWQFDRPDLGEGMVEAFRRDQSVYRSAALPLRGLEPAAVYQVTDLDTAAVSEATGQALMENGLSVEIGAKPGAALLVYKKKAQ